MRKNGLRKIIDGHTPTAAQAMAIKLLHCPLDDRPMDSDLRREMHRTSSDYGDLHEGLEHVGLRTDTYMRVNLNAVTDVCKRNLVSWCWGFELVICRVRRYLSAVRRVQCFVLRCNFLRCRQLDRMYRWWVEAERDKRQRDYEAVKARQGRQHDAHFSHLLGADIDCFVPNEVKQMTVYTAYRMCWGHFCERLRGSRRRREVLERRLRELRGQYRREELRREGVSYHVPGSTGEALAGLILQTGNALATVHAEEPVFRFRPGDVPLKQLVAMSKEQVPRAVAARVAGGLRAQPQFWNWGLALDSPVDRDAVADDGDARAAAPGDAPGPGPGPEPAASALPVGAEGTAVRRGRSASVGRGPDGRACSGRRALAPPHARARARSLEPPCRVGGPCHSPLPRRRSQSLAPQPLETGDPLASSPASGGCGAGPRSDVGGCPGARARSRSLEPGTGRGGRRASSPAVRRGSAQQPALGGSPSGRGLAGDLWRSGPGRPRGGAPPPLLDISPGSARDSGDPGAPRGAAVSAAQTGGAAEARPRSGRGAVARSSGRMSPVRGPEGAAPPAAEDGDRPSPSKAGAGRGSPVAGVLRQKSLSPALQGRGPRPASPAALGDGPGGAAPASCGSPAGLPPAHCHAPTAHCPRASGPDPGEGNPQGGTKLPRVSILTRPPLTGLSETTAPEPQGRRVSSCVTGASWPPPGRTPLRPEALDGPAGDRGQNGAAPNPQPHRSVPRWSRLGTLPPWQRQP